MEEAASGTPLWSRTPTRFDVRIEIEVKAGRVWLDGLVVGRGGRMGGLIFFKGDEIIETIKTK
jgi:hypothetical protein